MATAPGPAIRRCCSRLSGFAIVGIAVRVRKQGGKIAMARIGVTGLSNRALPGDGTSKRLWKAAAGTPAEIQAVAALVGQGIDANSDLHASADYRLHLAACLRESAGSGARAHCIEDASEDRGIVRSAASAASEPIKCCRTPRSWRGHAGLREPRKDRRRRVPA